MRNADDPTARPGALLNEHLLAKVETVLNSSLKCNKNDRDSGRFLEFELEKQQRKNRSARLDRFGPPALRALFLSPD